MKSIRALLGIGLLSFLLLSLTPLGSCVIFTYSSSNVDGWLVEANGGFWSETDGVFHLWVDGEDFTGVTLYREVEPENGFTFSLQVKADSFQQSAGLSGSDLQMGGIYVRADLPIGGNKHGFNYEYDFYDGGSFVFADEVDGGWSGHIVASAEPDAWYTMKLTLNSVSVTYNNFFTGRIESYEGLMATASVFDENGQQLGVLSRDLPFRIKDIRFIGFTVWGHLATNYAFKNIQMNGAQTPIGNDDNNPVPPSSISIMAQSLSTVAGSPVNVFGTLTDFNGSALQNKTIVLSYIFSGIESWIPISSGLTDEQGRYNIQWINSASGSFTLKASWNGDESGAPTRNQTSLSFLPYQDQQQNFIFESNSTIYNLGYNQTSSSLTFNVTGPSGTTGYVKATIAKSLLSDPQNLQGTMDGKNIDYTVDSTSEAWVFTFNYSHSTHQIVLAMASKPQVNILVIVVSVIAVVLCAVAACVGLSVYSKRIRQD